MFSSRSGAGGVVQEDIRGVVAAAFDHWDSRSGDPQLHTHVVVMNLTTPPSMYVREDSIVPHLDSWIAGLVTPEALAAGGRPRPGRSRGVVAGRDQRS